MAQRSSVVYRPRREHRGTAGAEGVGCGEGCGEGLYPSNKKKLVFWV